MVFDSAHRNIIQQNMALSFSQMLTPLTPAHQEVMSETFSLLIKNDFQFLFNLDQYEPITAGVTKNYLLLSHVKNSVESTYFCVFNSELRFEILRRQWPDPKTPGIPYGIRFEKGGPKDAIEIYHSNPGVINHWGQVLAKKINQRNFHQLFKAKKKIGKGAFASVYLAERLTDQKMVAVKAFSKEKQFSGDKGKESLENQIKLMRMVDHPNITKLEEIYETDNSIYVILECLHGKQLNEEIKGGRKFKEEQVIIIIQQILSALNHLAKKRIIHRDLKPENIMFKRENSLEVSICDFGLATYAEEEKYLFVRCGTPGFVAPEIINIKDMQTKSDPISDVFSAGVILHLLLLGYSVFPGKKYNEVLSQNRSCQFDFTRKEYSTLPASAVNLIIMMLEKNPLKRLNAEQCLAHPFLKGSTSNQMDIQEPAKKPFKEINFVKVPNRTLHFSKFSSNSEMDEQNTSKPSPSIGQSVKKKLSFLGNDSLGQAEVNRNFKRFM